MYWGPGGTQGSGDQLAVVYGCCRVRGQTLGALPLYVYTEDDQGRRTKATKHWAYKLLHDSPSDSQTSFEWRENMERDFCLSGNAYSLKSRIGKRIVSLDYLSAARIAPYIDLNYGVLYRYTGYNGKTEVYEPGQILHVKNFSMDGGITGISPLLRYVIEHALAANNYGRNFLKNGARPSGYLKFAGKRPNNDSTVDKIKSDWQEQYGGTENAGRTAVTWDGTTYETIGVNPQEAQLLDTAKLLTGDIAGAIYGVPRNMLGQPSETSTYASAEQFAIDFVRHTVSPQCKRYEQALNKALFTGEPNVFCKFDLDELQRGDSAAQSSYFSTLVQNGLMKRNEARRKLDLPEEEGADDLTVQSNLIDLDKLASALSAGTQPNQQPTGVNQP
jgi:HK97 family phage portal protein